MRRSLRDVEGNLGEMRKPLHPLTFGIAPPCSWVLLVAEKDNANLEGHALSWQSTQNPLFAKAEIDPVFACQKPMPKCRANPGRCDELRNSDEV